MKRKNLLKQLIPSLIMIILYVLLGNARSIQVNPYLEGGVIAVNMIIPVLAGILFGRFSGLMTGVLGTLINAFTPAGSLFEFAAIIPHGIMGFSAGVMRGNDRVMMPSFALVLGHGLNLVAFTLVGLIGMTTYLNIFFWYALTYEIFIGAVSIIIIATLYKAVFETEWH